MRHILLCAILCFASAASAQTTKPSTRPGGEIVAPQKRDVPGERIQLSHGRLFVPDYLAAGDKVNLILWFRGAAWCVEQVAYDAKPNAVLFTWDESKQKLGFKDEQATSDLIAEIEAALKTRKVGKICLGSFSGGYIAVLDLLRFERFREKVTDVVLADSLYPPRGAKDMNAIDPALAPIRDFAVRATTGEVRLIYSQLYPPLEEHRGNGSTVAARWLMNRAGVTPTECDERLPDGRRLLYRAEKSGLNVFGVAGMTNQDHFDHLYHMDTLLRQTSMCNGGK